MEPQQEERIQAFTAARAQRPRWPGIPPHLRPTSIADGYALQHAIHQRLASDGTSRLGYKVGSTSAAGQQKLGLQEPVYAGIHSDGRNASLGDALRHEFAEPGLECEIAVVLRADVDGADPGLTEQHVADAIGICHIACEIIDNRYRDPSAVGTPSLIADDFFHAAFVIGAANPDWRSQDLAHVDAAIEIDQIRSAGNAADVMSAFGSVLWLARKLATSGQRLRAGEIVLSGAVVGPVWITLPARSVSLHIHGFAPLTLQE